MKPLLILLALFAVGSAAFAEPAKAPPTLENGTRQPFRIVFQSYEGDPTKPDQMNFGVSALSLRQPSNVLTLGEIIPRTQLKLVRFEAKTGIDSKGEKVDQSELTLLNVETKVSSVLVLAKPKHLHSPTK